MATIRESERDQITKVLDAMCEAACKHPAVRLDDITAFVGVRGWLHGLLAAAPVQAPAKPETFVDKVQEAE